MLFTLLLLVSAAAIFTGLLTLFWTIRIFMVALNKFAAKGSDGLVLVLTTSITAVICFALIRVTMALAGQIYN